jgi:excisionase family DNA binding protein
MPEPPLVRDRLIGLTKAARDLGVSKRTLRRAVQQGELPRYVIGQRGLLKIADVRAWLTLRRRF